MPLSLTQLCAQLNPSKTSLLLGAGASIPSGAPSAVALAMRLWRDVGASESLSDDLSESATLLERRYTRKAVVDSVVAALGSLKPTGGLLALPRFAWRRLYSTNFDRLAELAYESNNIPLTTIKSNFDYSKIEASLHTVLFKIHGCMTEDRSLGQRASMILTEQDYEDFKKYRQALFSHLEQDLLTGDVLVIGQSLRDRHLSDLVKRILEFKNDGAPGKLFVLVYDQDDLRAELLEDRGARIAFGGINEFFNQLSQATVTKLPTPGVVTPHSSLPTNLISSIVDVSHARGFESTVLRMFNGGAATYADIENGVTFERAGEAAFYDAAALSSKRILSIIGPAGSGKTTLSRRLLVHFADLSYICYEHRIDFPFLSQHWIEYEHVLRGSGRKVVLFLDECTKYLREVNSLCAHIGAVSNCALTVVLTANAANWAPRIKNSAIFSHGYTRELGRLVDADLHGLVNLVEQNPSVAALVQPEFRRQTRGEQFDSLRRKCSAEMFVCLKLIFGNESLDQIVLREFNQLDKNAQEYYRYIAALETVGIRVHRQLAIRMLGLRADQVRTILDSLVGIVDEYSICEDEGLFGWSTRHIVIARKITEFKFSSFEDLLQLFNSVIDNINPSVQTELQSARDICDAEHGIGRLAEASTRMQLYERLVKITPDERIPWHRLIREILNTGDYDRAEQAIREAINAVRSDPPLERYKVQVTVARAKNLPGLTKSDRLALLRKAYEQATLNTERFREDKVSYRTLCEVAQDRCAYGDTPHVLYEAIAKMRTAKARILDPELTRDLHHYEQIHARLASAAP